MSKIDNLLALAQQSDTHSMCTCWFSSNQQTTLCFPQSILVVSTSLTTIRQIESFPKKIRGENNRCIFTTTYNLQYHIWKARIFCQRFCSHLSTPGQHAPNLALTPPVEMSQSRPEGFTIQVSEGKFR